MSGGAPDLAGPAFVSALCTALAWVLLVRRPPLDRARRIFDVAGSRPGLSPVRIVQLCCLVAGAVVLGGAAGLIAGLAAAAVAPTLMGRLERRADVQRRERLQRQFPVVSDLLSVALAAGRPAPVAIREVAEAVEEPAAAQLSLVAHRMILAAGTHDAWQDIDPVLSQIGQVMRRSERSGTPVAQVLSRAADDHRRNARAEIQRRVQRVSVRTAAPLGMCFLPAFFLIGVCPVLIGAVQQLLP